MNQFDIEAQLDRDLAEREKALEKKLRNSQRIILNQLAAMYAKYEREGDLTYQEMQRYNRLDNELKRINETLTAEYSAIVAVVQVMQENHYLLKFLLTAYLLDQFVARPKLPTGEVVGAALIFILGSLKLPRLPRTQENEVTKKLQAALTAGIDSNDSQDDFTRRIERALPKGAKTAAPELGRSLIERIETPINTIQVVQPMKSEVKSAVRNEDKELSLLRIFTRHRNYLSKGILDEITTGLKKGESYAQVAKRLEEEFDMSVNRARLVARTESGRVRALANERVYTQVSKVIESTKVWSSSLDSRVRDSHRKLDKKEADKNGNFVYKGNIAPAPKLFVGPNSASLNINCRCVVILKVDGQLPEYRRGRDYRDEGYQNRLAARIDALMADEGLTYKQAIKKAQKEILPPGRLIPYVSYETWLQSFGEIN